MAPNLPRMTEADKDEIRAYHKQGLTQREIAAKTGRPAGTISSFCHRNGLEFDGSNTEAATARRVLDAKERVSLLRLELIAVQEHRVAEIRAVQRGEKRWKTVLRGTGASEGEAELSFIPPNDYAREQSAASQASTAIKNYAPLQTENTEAAKSMADKVIEALGMTKDGETNDGAYQP